MNNQEKENIQFIVNSYTRRLVNVAPRGTKSTVSGFQRMPKKLEILGTYQAEASQ